MESQQVTHALWLLTQSTITDITSVHSNLVIGQSVGKSIQFAYFSLCQFISVGIQRKVDILFHCIHLLTQHLRPAMIVISGKNDKKKSAPEQSNRGSCRNSSKKEDLMKTIHPAIHSVDLMTICPDDVMCKPPLELKR